MRKYNVLGGGQITAATDLGIIEALRDYSQDWIPSVGIEDFIEGMAARCMTQKGVVIRTHTIAHFVTDLVQHGFLTPVS